MFMDKEFIDNFIKQFGSTGCTYEINQNLVDVNGSMYINQIFAKEKLPFAFGHIEGDFYAEDCFFTTMENFPKSISAEFRCTNNLLKSLKFLPKCNIIYLQDNKIVSLQDCPFDSLTHINLSNNLFTNLEGLPDVLSTLDLGTNPNLVSLKGLPKQVRTIVCYLDSIKDPYELRYLLYSNIMHQHLHSTDSKLIESAMLIIEAYKGKSSMYHIAIEELMNLGEEYGIIY